MSCMLLWARHSQINTQLLLYSVSTKKILLLFDSEKLEEIEIMVKEKIIDLIFEPS